MSLISLSDLPSGAGLRCQTLDNVFRIRVPFANCLLRYKLLLNQSTVFMSIIRQILPRNYPTTFRTAFLYYHCKLSFLFL